MPTQAKIEEVRRHREALIAQHGWMVQSVFPTAETPDAPPFAYSIGLHDRRLPELLVIGLPPQAGQVLVNDVAQLFVEALAESKDMPRGQIEHPRWPKPFYLLPVLAEAVADWATGAIRRSGGEARFIQVCWPDKEGRFPWDPQFSEQFLKAQPALGRPPSSLN